MEKEKYREQGIIVTQLLVLHGLYNVKPITCQAHSDI